MPNESIRAVIVTQSSGCFFGPPGIMQECIAMQPIITRFQDSSVSNIAAVVDGGCQARVVMQL